MKKISLYILSLLAAVAFTACDEDYKDWADPQANGPEEQVSITFQAGNASQTVFNLNTITDAAVAIATQSLTKEEGTTASYDAHLSTANTFSPKATIKLQADGSTLSVTKANLQSAITELFGKRPDERTVHIRINAYVTTTDGQTSLARSNAFEIKVTPEAPLIEAEYYFIGDANNWSIDNLDDYKFTHSGNDVYDDPVFTYVVYTADACNFKIVPKSSKEAASWDGVLGNAIDQNPDAEGALIIENSQAMRIVESGLYRITIDMMEYTYKVERLGDNLPESAYYLIGTPSGWSGTDVNSLLKFNHSGKDVVDDPYFTLLFESPGDCYWKVLPQSNVTAVEKGTNADFWSGTVLGTAVDGDTSLNGTISPTAGGAMQVKEKGWVKITLNMMEFTYKIEILGDALPMPETMYMIGTPWGWDWNNVGDSMTPVHSNAGKFWAVQYFDAGAEMKFCSVKAWSGDFGYGGATIPDSSISYAGLSDNGGNIKIANAGWYLVVVTGAYTDDSKTTIGYTVEFLEPAIWLVGDAASDGWNSIAEKEADKFTIPTAADGEFVSPAFAKNAELRMCVKMNGVDWWQSEFIILNGEIAYRGTGDDQSRVNVTAGQKAYLKFSDNTGRIQ